MIAHADIASARISKLGQGSAQLPGCRRMLIVDDSKVQFMSKASIVMDSMMKFYVHHFGFRLGFFPPSFFISPFPFPVLSNKVNCRVLIRRLKLALPPSWDILSSCCAEDVFDDIIKKVEHYDIIITDEYLGMRLLIFLAVISYFMNALQHYSMIILI